MFLRELAESIVEQADKHGWGICCLCKHFDPNFDYVYRECVACEKFNEEYKKAICVDGVKAWLTNWQHKLDVEKAKKPIERSRVQKLINECDQVLSMLNAVKVEE